MNSINITPTAFQLENIDRSPSLELVYNKNNARKWVWRKDGLAFNKQGRWEREGIPSNRTPGFLSRTRFSSETEALKAIHKVYTQKQAAGVLDKLVQRLKPEPSFAAFWHTLSSKQRAQLQQRATIFLRTEQYPIFSILSSCKTPDHQPLLTSLVPMVKELSNLLCRFMVESNLDKLR